MFGRPSGHYFFRNFWRKLQFFKVLSYECGIQNTLFFNLESPTIEISICRHLEANISVLQNLFSRDFFDFWSFIRLGKKSYYVITRKMRRYNSVMVNLSTNLISSQYSPIDSKSPANSEIIFLHSLQKSQVQSETCKIGRSFA